MLNPALNVSDLADTLRQRGRILIRNVLTPEAADRLSHCLREEVP